MPAQQRPDAGERVHAARTNRNWSQTQLADVVGCSQAVVSRLETGGQVSFNILERLTDALGLKHDELIADADQRTPDVIDPNNDLRNALKRVAQVIFQRAYAERMSEMLTGISPLVDVTVAVEIRDGDGIDQFGSMPDLVETLLPQMPKSDDPL